MGNPLFQVKPVSQYQGARYPGQSDADDELVEERAHPLVIIMAMILVVGVSIGMIGCYLRSDYVPETPQPDGGPDGDPPDPPDCEGDEVQCVDSWTPEVCVDGRFEAIDCGVYCTETFGWEYWSMGCDAEADDPCMCEYDVMDGAAPYCEPGDVFCLSENTVEICNDYYPETYNCADYCVEQLGEGAISYGCNEIAEDPCQCDYDIIGGVRAVCTPEDIVCIDDQTLGDCNEYGDIVYRDCDEYCVEIFGSEYLSEGCDMAVLDNPCQCGPAYSDSGE